MKNVENPVEAERYALDLYGGKEAVIKRMGSSIKSKLEKKLIGEALEFSLYSRIPFETLTQILKGDYSEVNYKIFEKLEGYLNLNIWDVLGEPDLSNSKVKKYWKAQSKDKNAMPYIAKVISELVRMAEGQ